MWKNLTNDQKDKRLQKVGIALLALSIYLVAVFYAKYALNAYIDRMNKVTPTESVSSSEEEFPVIEQGKKYTLVPLGTIEDSYKYVESDEDGVTFAVLHEGQKYYGKTENIVVIKNAFVQVPFIEFDGVKYTIHLQSQEQMVS